MPSRPHEAAARPGLPMRTVGALAAATGLRMFGLFLLLPVVAPHVAAHPGGGALLAGLAVGAYGLTQAVALVPLGWLSDRLGRRAVLAGGMALFAAGGCIGGWVDDPAWLVAGRFIQGLGAVAAVALAAVADATGAEARARGMAVVGAAIAVAFGLALVCAGPLAATVGVPGMMRMTGWLGLGALAVVLVAPLAPQPPVVARARSSLPPGLKRLCAGVCALHAAMAALFVVLPLRLVALVELDGLWRVYLVAFGLALVVAVPMIGWRSRSPAVWRGAVVMVALPALALPLAGAAGLLAAGALLTLFFAGFCYLEAVMPARAAGLAQPGTRGTVMGMYAVTQALGVFAGGWLGGVMADWLQ